MAIPQQTKDGKGYFKHIWGETNAWLANVTQLADQQRGLNVYYALSGFDPDGSRDKFGRLQRVATNVVAVRSFWLDIDVGEDKPYPSQRAAAEAVLAFVEAVGLPRPFIVSSGGGIHVYWPMVEDMDPAEWRRTAQALKVACKVHELAADPSRTSDAASVLRPPGTHHRKGEPRPVRVVVEGVVSGLAQFQDILAQYAGDVEPADELGPRPSHIAEVDNSDLTGGVEQRSSSAEKAATKCGVLALLRDSKGNVDQPTWYYSLGVMAFQTDGTKLAHEWSSGHRDYTHAETEAKLMQAATVGHPTSCAKLSDYQPTICAACPFNGKVKTPWSLGVYDPGEVQVRSDKVVKTAKGFTTVPASTVEFPNGYTVTTINGRKVLQHWGIVTDDEGQEKDEWVPFCETAFWPVSRLWIEGVAHVECEMSLPKGESRRFMLEGGLIGKGKDSLAAELARNEIVPLTNKGFVVDSYMKRWMTHLVDTAEQRVAYRHFGWGHDRSFALGDTVMHPGGGETRAILVGMAKSKGIALETKGDLQTWVDVVDKAYNAPGQEAFQFLVACGFAAPLLSMMRQVSGVTVYAHSEGSGVGKTTAQRVALSAWGDWEQLMLADGKTTENAMWGLMGAYHSLPIVYDELTNMRNDAASQLVFSTSSGRSKERMAASGELRDNNSNWCTILLASGNNLLSEKLALHRGNAEAEISRLFEFTLRATPHLSPNDANALFPKLLTNYGHAGRLYARYLVDNYDEIEKRLLAAQEKLNAQLGITQVERYWSALIAAVMVATAICRTLGLLSFDLTALKTWLVERLSENRVQRDDATNDPLELFGSMLSDLWQGILVTNGEGDIRKGTAAAVIEKPRGPLVGRAILPSDNNSKPVLLLNSQSVKDWSNKKGVSAREIFAAALKAGWVEQELVRYSLGRGTIEYANTSSYIRCWKVNPDRIAGTDAGRLVSAKLTSIQGGLDAASSS